MPVSKLYRAYCFLNKPPGVLSLEQSSFEHFNRGLIVCLYGVCACVTYAFALDESFVQGFGVVGFVMKVFVEILIFWFLKGFCV